MSWQLLAGIGLGIVVIAVVVFLAWFYWATSGDGGR